MSFFVDPQIVNDKDARAVTHITLSYTFYPMPAPKPGLAEKRTGTAGLVGIQLSRRSARSETGRGAVDGRQRTPSTTTITS